MTWAWIVPTAVAAVGVVVMAVVARRTARDAAGLQRDLDGVARLQPALVEARDEMASTADAVRRMRGDR